MSSSDYSTKLGLSHENKAVSPTRTNDQNKKFWDLRNEEFFGRRKGKFTGYKATSEIFTGLYNSKGTGNNNTVKDKCKEAHDTATSTDGKTSKITEDIKRFCYLEPEDTKSQQEAQ